MLRVSKHATFYTLRSESENASFGMTISTPRFFKLCAWKKIKFDQLSIYENEYRVISSNEFEKL